MPTLRTLYFVAVLLACAAGIALLVLLEHTLVALARWLKWKRKVPAWSRGPHSKVRGEGHGN